MYLIPIAWMYVALMMSVAEATNTNGTVLGALITFVLYGLLPVGLMLYFMATPARRRRIRAREAAEHAAAQQATALEVATPGGATPESATPRAGSAQPDAGRLAPADPVTPVREEP